MMVWYIKRLRGRFPIEFDYLSSSSQNGPVAHFQGYLLNLGEPCDVWFGVRSATISLS